MPLYTFRNNMTGEVIETTDPLDCASITGKWEHWSLFGKGPAPRGLASRAPYFHNGLAATLANVVDFDDSRFNIGLSAKEKFDLVAFLKALWSIKSVHCNRGASGGSRITCRTPRRRTTQSGTAPVWNAGKDRKKGRTPSPSVERGGV